MIKNILLIVSFSFELFVCAFDIVFICMKLEGLPVLIILNISSFLLLLSFLFTKFFTFEKTVISEENLESIIELLVKSYREPKFDIIKLTNDEYWNNKKNSQIANISIENPQVSYYNMIRDVICTYLEQ